MVSRRLRTQGLDVCSACEESGGLAESEGNDEVRPFQEDGKEFRSRILKLESRKYIRLLDAGAGRSTEFVRMCGWCKKVYAKTGWIEVEEAIERLGLFGASQPPQTTHTICPTCKENISQFRMIR